MLMTTTAGISRESVMLEAIYQRGLQGERLDEDLEVYRADDLVMFWSHRGRQPWQTGPDGERYYVEQRRSLRLNTYLPLHENRWVFGEGAFVTAEQYDRCVVAEWDGLEPGQRDVEVHAGWDIALRHDTQGLVACFLDPTTEQVIVAAHRVWVPSGASRSTSKRRASACCASGIATIAGSPSESIPGKRRAPSPRSRPPDCPSRRRPRCRRCRHARPRRSRRSSPRASWSCTRPTSSAPRSSTPR